MATTRLKAIAAVIILSMVALVITIGSLATSVKPQQTVTRPTRPPPIPPGGRDERGGATVARPGTEAVTAKSSAISEQAAPAEAGEIVATVNGRAISRAAWEQATRLDAAMNTLAGQPSPNPEETLGRLINETLVLEARMPARSFSEADAEARLRALMGHWQVSGDTLIDTLDTVGLTRQDLITSISHLLIVENVIQQLTAEGIDVNEWLTRARNQAEVGLYQPITATTSPEPEPEPELATAPAPPTPALPEPPADLPIQPYPDAVAPDFTLTTLRGESVTLSELRGRPTIINFWASWCPPCRRELPALQATYDAHQDDINFLAVNLKEPKGTVRSFAEDIGLTFPILLDEQGQVGDQLYQVRGIPTTFFVNARGVVVNRHVGPLDEATIEAYLQPLLAPRRNERSRSSG